MILDPIVRADLHAVLAEFERLDQIWPAPPSYVAECERAMIDHASLQCRPVGDVVNDAWLLLYAEAEELSEADRDRLGLHDAQIAMRRHTALREARRSEHQPEVRANFAR